MRKPEKLENLEYRGFLWFFIFHFSFFSFLIFLFLFFIVVFRSSPLFPFLRSLVGVGVGVEGDIYHGVVDGVDELG